MTDDKINDAYNQPESSSSETGASTPLPDQLEESMSPAIEPEVSEAKFSDSRPIFKSEVENPQYENVDNLQIEQTELRPEEVEADVLTPDSSSEVQGGGLTQPPADPVSVQSDKSPLSSLLGDNRGKLFILVGGVFFFFFILIILLGLLFGRKKQDVKLVYWGLWEEKSVYEPLIKEYKAKNPNVSIVYEKKTPQEYREKLLTQGKKGIGPDIFRFHNTWIPEIKEIVAPIDRTVLSNEEFEQTFYPIHQKDLKVENQYFGIPLMIDGLVLLYNDNLFKKAGLSRAPVSWEDITTMAGQLTVKDKTNRIITSGIALGTANNIDHFSDIFGLFLVQNGAADITKLDSKEAAGALQAYRGFAEANGVPPKNVWDEQMPNSLTAFTQEKVAMIIVPSWRILEIKTANPDLQLKVAPVPVLPGSQPISVASYWVEGVSKYSKNQKEAWKFLHFLSQKENMTKLYENEVKAHNLFGEPYSRVDLGSSLKNDPYLGPVITQASVFASIPTISVTFDGDSGLNDGINKYIEKAITATSQGDAYDSALKTAKEGIDEILGRFEIIQP